MVRTKRKNFKFHLHEFKQYLVDPKVPEKQKKIFMKTKNFKLNYSMHIRSENLKVKIEML